MPARAVSTIRAVSQPVDEPVDELAVAVAAYGLPSTHRLPDLPLADAAFSMLLLRCEAERTLGLLGAAVRDHQLAVNDEQRILLESSWSSWLSHSLVIERLVLRALAILRAAGVPSRVLKGVALAHTAYPHPEQRVFGDVDLLVSGADLQRAVSALCGELDLTRVQPELRPGFDARFGKEVLLRAPDGLELDLHRVFVDGALGMTIALDDLFTPAYRFPLGGLSVEALPMPARLLHACYAAAIGDWPARLGSLRDVAQLVVRDRPHLADVLITARRWRCELVVARAVDAAWRELAIVPRPPIVEWAARYQPNRMERVLLAAHQGSARSFTRHAAAVLVLPGVADRAAYLRAIALPQRDYLGARRTSRAAHVVRAAKRMIRR